MPAGLAEAFGAGRGAAGVDGGEESGGIDRVGAERFVICGVHLRHDLATGLFDIFAPVATSAVGRRGNRGARPFEDSVNRFVLIS